MPTSPSELYVNRDDDIDLFELVEALWNRKTIIITITAVVITLAIAYLLITPKVYEAKIVTNEAQSAHLAQLNVGKKKLGQYAQAVNPELAYKLFQQNLKSIQLARNYFKANVEAIYKETASAATTEKLLEKFLESISVSAPDKISEQVAITHQYTNPTLTAEWLNNYVAYINEQTKEQLIQAAQNNKKLAIKEYYGELSSLRAVYNQRLQDSLARLNEAYSIAKKLNIKKPLESNIQLKVQSRALDESLLYMRGYEVLAVEIEAIKTRKLIDPFIPQIRTIQEAISYLASVEYSMDTLQVVKIDSWAEAPKESIKPKKPLVLVLAGLLGGMLGVFIALIFWVVENRRKAER